MEDFRFELEYLENRYGEDFAWRVYDRHYDYYDEWRSATNAAAFYRGQIKGAMRSYRQWLESYGIHKVLGNDFTGAQDKIFQTMIRDYYAQYRRAIREFTRLDEEKETHAIATGFLRVGQGEEEDEKAA